jgi:acetyl-CoA carboxylase biotin carboxyl carrier protein
VELKQVKELIALMEKAGLRRLRIKDKNGEEVELERMSSEPAHSGHPLYPHPEVHPRFPHVSGHLPIEEKKEEGKFITSPMVGTMYASPSPDDPHFVKVGDRVDEDTVVCIVEAMKVMNEVKAGIKGAVAEVFVQNGRPVEFGTKLFRIT